MKSKSIFKILIVFGILFLCVVQASAIGVMYSRPRWGEVEYDKMWIKSVTVDVDIQDQIGVTHVDQIFHNDTDTSVEGVYIFPLPENAMVSELVYWFNGKRYIANIREREEAVQAYNDKVRKWLDPALLEYLGDNLFRLKIAPIPENSDVRTEITYVELLPYDFGRVNYTFLLNTTGLSPKPLETVLLTLNARTQSRFKSFRSPSHANSSATQITEVFNNHYRLIFGDENFYPDKDLVVQFETLRDEIRFDVQTYVPVPVDSFGTDSFYALWVTPPDSIAPDDVIPKRIVFTADVSSSMEGQRILQVKEALDNFIDLLNSDDLFNILTFGTVVNSFRPDLVTATPSNIQKAHEFVFQMYALGMTNIDDALTQSLAQSFNDGSSNNLIFLTDGFPTFGETRIDQIVANAKINNTDDVRIFSFGVGEDISRPLLINLSNENHGYAEFITSDAAISDVVTNHFKRMTKPVLTDLNIHFGGLSEFDHYPKVLPDLFYGTQVMQMGKYIDGGSYKVTLGGRVRQQGLLFDKQITFPTVAGGHRFVPKLWANAKIDNLFEMIVVMGEQQELVDQVIELSLMFQILTPYTAFYSDPDEDPPDNGNQGGASAVSADGQNGHTFMLHQNYPNPFNPSTEIKYSIPSNGFVMLKIYDIQGRLIKVLVQNTQNPGAYTIRWDGRNAQGAEVAAGMYVYRLSFRNHEGETTVISRKMSLVR